MRQAGSKRGGRWVGRRGRPAPAHTAHTAAAHLAAAPPAAARPRARQQAAAVPATAARARSVVRPPAQPPPRPPRRSLRPLQRPGSRSAPPPRHTLAHPALSRRPRQHPLPARWQRRRRRPPAALPAGRRRRPPAQPPAAAAACPARLALLPGLAAGQTRPELPAPGRRWPPAWRRLRRRQVVPTTSGAAAAGGPGRWAPPLRAPHALQVHRQLAAAWSPAAGPQTCRQTEMQGHRVMGAAHSRAAQPHAGAIVLVVCPTQHSSTPALITGPLQQL